MWSSSRTLFQLTAVSRRLLQAATASSSVDFNAPKFDYSKKTPEELRALIAKRDEQIRQLRGLHEQAHRNAEYYHRMQLLEWEEKAVVAAQVSGQLSSDTMTTHRHRLEELRKMHDMNERVKGLWRWMLFLATIGLVIWLPRHYVYRPGMEAKGAMGSSQRIAGPTWFGSYTALSARSRDTAYDIEVKERKAARKKARLEAKEAAAAAGSATVATEGSSDNGSR